MIKLKSLFRRSPGSSSSSSGSKHPSAGGSPIAGNAQQLKTAASVSSLDTIERPPTKSKSKGHHYGSKDRLFKGSRDKLSAAASRESLAVHEVTAPSSSKPPSRPPPSVALAAQQQQQLQQQQQSINIPQQQQQQQHAVGNKHLSDSRAVSYAINAAEQPSSSASSSVELTDINFDGPKEVIYKGY